MKNVLLAALFVSLCACATTRRDALDLRRATVVDLTWTLDERTLYWPGSPSGFELTRLAHGPTPGGFFYASNSFCTPEHGGTHLDAPIHFAAEGRTVDQIPVRQLIGPAVVIDVTGKAEADRDYRLQPEDIAAWERMHGTIERGSIVLLRTGWGSRYGDRKAYFGDDDPRAADNLHFPSFGEAAARLLIEQRGVGAIGIDTASIDFGPSHEFLVHRLAGEANVPGLENVANLEQLPPRGAWLIALPVKIGGGSGSPVRIVALVP